MTQEEKDLLLKDLYARLSYGVKFKADNEEYIREIHYIKDENVYIREYQNLSYWIDTIKPYLRPMSSMTAEELDFEDALETESPSSLKGLNAQVEYNPSVLRIKTEMYGLVSDVSVRTETNEYPPIDQVDMYLTIDWLNEHHFDYRGLIEKGIALEAPKGMYEY